MVEHGGRLRDAARVNGIPFDKWLDLSTGINPKPWPFDRSVVGGWERLPEQEDGLEEAARAAYGVAHLTPVAGSMEAIRALPRLFPHGPVAMLAPTFNEHAVAWERAGRPVWEFPAERMEEGIAQLSVAVVCQPNNPTGHTFDRETLLDWGRRLHERGGGLIVDEAFADATPEASVAADAGPGLVVLRSVGKFYGLAGIRVGFVIAEPSLLSRLDDELGPWRVAGPSRSVATAALKDELWRKNTIRHLAEQSTRLARLLTGHGLTPTGGTHLFKWVVTDDAPRLQEELAKRAILVRRFDTPSSLRFGLPGDEEGWRRLDAALGEVTA